MFQCAVFVVVMQTTYSSRKTERKKRNIIYEHAFYVNKYICALLHFTSIWLMIEIRASQNRIKEELGDSVLSPDSKLAADLLMQKSEPGSLPVKKKRNSYADSPHKLNCPHCPRSFPWVSSLNRHMLTHTGKMKRILFYFWNLSCFCGSYIIVSK